MSTVFDAIFPRVCPVEQANSRRQQEIDAEGNKWWMCPHHFEWYFAGPDGHWHKAKSGRGPGWREAEAARLTVRD